MTANELILYKTEDGKTQIYLKAEEGTVWLTQAKIAELFQTSKQNVGKHLKNIFEEEELDETSVVNKKLTPASDGKEYLTFYYNLDLILSVGYRIKSPRGSQFRRWATTTLKEYLIKGFVLNDERLKDPKGWDYFDELLERIREIRAPISFSDFGIFFLDSTGRATFGFFTIVTDGNMRRNLNKNVDMVTGNNTVHDFDPHLFGNLSHNFTNALFQLVRQNFIAVLRDPHDVVSWL